MHSISVWKNAERPNYNVNVDKVFPYSEVPYLGDYNLVKIPESLNNLIQHVDYWGEGKIVSGDGKGGFTNCYNVNHQYQLVSNGLDRDKKIPNRVPVLSYTNCDTSGYIKDNSVITVTVAGGHINTSCAKDIARIVNNDLGKVVAFGFDSTSQEIINLTTELREKGLFYCPDYTLPSELQGLTLYKSYIAFLNVSSLRDELYEKVTKGSYDNAVNITQSMKIKNGETINEIVTKLIGAGSRNIMAYAYKLWHADAKDVVRNYFPTSFRLIFNEDNVKIINKQYYLALKLDANKDSYNDRLAWGDSSDKTSKRVSWNIIPVWDANSVTFKLYNVDCDMYLKLDYNEDNIGDRKAWGSNNSGEVRHRYYLEPVMKNETLAFFIINCQFQQGLKLDMHVDSIGDRLLWGHNGTVYNNDERFRWIIPAW